jgi:hypothetical protein
MGDARPNWLPCLIIRLIIKTIRLDRSGSDQIDEASNVSRPDRSGADQIDVEHQAADLVLKGHSGTGIRDHGERAVAAQGKRL